MNGLFIGRQVHQEPRAASRLRKGREGKVGSGRLPREPGVSASPGPRAPPGRKVADRRYPRRKWWGCGGQGSVPRNYSASALGPTSQTPPCLLKSPAIAPHTSVVHPQQGSGALLDAATEAVNTPDTEPDGFSASGFFLLPRNLNLDRLPWELGLLAPPPAALGCPAKPLLGHPQGPRRFCHTVSAVSLSQTTRRDSGTAPLALRERG